MEGECLKVLQQIGLILVGMQEEENYGSMKSSRSDRDMKQHFLRSQIIDCGYEPDDFVQFLNEKLDIQSDLDNCTLQQLQEVVAEFKSLKQQESQELKSYFRQESQPMSEPFCEKMSALTDDRKVIIRCQPVVEEDEFLKATRCIKIIPKNPEIKNLDCVVNDPERKQLGGIMGIGGTSYLCFKVWSFGNKPVFRRYSDFIWLRKTLVKFYPTRIIPPIPNKKAAKRSTRQIEKRMRILTMFLNDVVRNSVLLSNKYVQGFLTLESHSQFEKLKESADSIKPYETIRSTESLTGSVWLELTDRTIDYKDGLIKLVPEAEKLYKEITRNSKKMRAMTVENINLLYEMSNQFAELHEITSKFNSFAPSDPTKKLSQIYAVLNNVMAEWGNSLREQIEVIEKNLSTFFKYVREEFMGFREVLIKEEQFLVEFIKQKELLQKQKEKIFQLKDPKKWDIPKNEVQNIPKSAIFDKREAFNIMLPKESVRIEQMKEKLAFYLSEINRNGEENFLRTVDKFCENFKQFSIKMKVSNQRVGAMWSEVSAKFSDPFNKPQDIQRMQTITEEDSQAASNIY